MDTLTPDWHAESNKLIDITHYWRMIKRYKFFIAGVTIMFFILGMYIAINSTPIYSATAKIQADPVQPNANASDQYIMNSMVFLFYETQYEIIRSRNVAESVVDKLNLVEKYKQELTDSPSSKEESLVTSLKSYLKELAGVKEEEGDSEPMSDQQLRIMLAQGIQSQLRVEGGTQSQIINISYESDSPTKASEIVNAVANAYIEFGLEARLGQIKDTAAWLSEQLQELKDTLQSSEEALRTYRLSSGLMDTEQQARLANNQLANLDSELLRAKTALSGAEELYKQVEQAKVSSGNLRALGPVLQSQVIRDLIREETSQSRKVEELSERYGEKHPKMISARSELAVAVTNLNREVDKIVDNIGKEYRLAQVQVDNIETLVSQTKQELQSYQGDSFELTRLEREVENNRRIYESFLGRLMEADVSGDYDASNVRIIDSATVPQFPIKPRVSLIVIATTFLGAMFAVTFVFLREAFGNVFKTPDQIEEQLNIPSLGITPLVKKQKDLNVAPERQYLADQRSSFSEAINTIRTGLLFSNLEKPPQSILITSTNGSEGKTTLAINLAVAFSQLDRTLLIELDLRKPAIANDLDLNNKIGLSDLLTGSASDSNMVAQIDGAPNLSVITCGTIPPNPMELISSKRFSTLLASLKEKFAYIVIDSPPTLPVSDACILSKMADATLIAVKADQTTFKMSNETVNRLKRVNANVVGAILTQASTQKMAYYGEHYSQNSYYGLDESKA